MNRVAELRSEKTPGQSREDFARIVGCSGEQIRKLEMGFANPGIVLARKVAAALGVSIDEAFPDEAFGKRKKGRAA